MSTEDLAWLTGFYEGEGTCGFYSAKTPTKRGHFPKRLTMSIGQRERAVLDTIQTIVGYGYVWDRTKTEFSVFGCSGTKAYELLRAMRPYMRAPYKIAQVERALRAWEGR